MWKFFVCVLKWIDCRLNDLLGGGFGLKDVFTIFNLLGGVTSIYFSIHGNIKLAAAAVMIGYLGDVLDGPIARVTGRGNPFGGELDSIADHLSQCIAPAFVVYVFFRDISTPLGFALASILIVTGSVRHARNAAVPFGFSLCWNGMPRPVAAFLVLSFINSHFITWFTGGVWVGVGLVLVVSIMNLVPLPFLNHHGRKLQLYVKVLVVGSFALCIALAVLFPPLFWDALFLIIFGYSWFSWVPMSREERKSFFDAVRAWKKELNKENQ